MNLKKTTLSIWMLLSILTIFLSCKGNVNNAPTSIKKESNKDDQIALDSKATPIYQDKKNNLWFASKEKGVYKYDRGNLVLFTSKDGLESYQIISVQEDNSGNLYFDTPEGIYKYNGQQFTTLKVAENDTKKSEWKLKPTDLWFRMGWKHKGPFRYDGEKLHPLEFPKSNIEDEFYKKYPNASYNPYSIFSIFKDSKGSIWFGTSDLGIYQFDGNRISWMHEEHLGTTSEGGNFGIRSIAEDKDGYMWICNTSYKYKILPDTNVDMNLNPIKYKREKGITNNDKKTEYFMGITPDDNENLWMINGDGLYLNNGEELIQFFIHDGERNISPTSFFKDNQGVFWLGTDKFGIYTYDGDTFEKFKI
jgi:ligand-binding sensor domain-containing protein